MFNAMHGVNLANNSRPKHHTAPDSIRPIEPNYLS